MGSGFAKNLLFALGVGAVCAAPASAQQFNFTRYNDGLPQAQILALHQDNRGFLWVGTYGGVARFDGSSFRAYSRQHGLISNTITAITQDEKGRIVVGVDGGVCTLNEALFQCHEWKRDIGGDRSFEVLAEAEGSRWVATSKGLVHLDGHQQLRVYRVPGTNGAVSISRDRTGTLWVGTGVGLARFRNDTVVLLDDASLNGQQITRIRMLDGEPLVTTPKGVFRVSNGVATPLAGTSELNVTTIMDALPGPDSVVWIATHQGVVRARGGVLQHITRKDGLADDIVNRLLVDREGDLWLSTEAGLSRMSPNPFRHMAEAEGLPQRFVRAVAEDTSGVLWVGTRDGIAYRDGDRFIPVRIPSPEKIRVFAIAPLPGNGLLIGTSRGLAHHKNGRTTWFTERDGLPAIHVLSLLRDTNGGVWVGTRGGVARWESGRIAAVKDSMLASANGLSMAYDSVGHLWVGTVTGGVVVYDGQRSKRLNDASGLSDQPIWQIARDKKGRMWIGTNGDGAFRISPSGVIEKFGIAQGLQDPFVWQVLIDSLDRVWMYTNRGIDRIDGKAMRHLARGDGLSDLEGSAGAALETRDGVLWFGTSTGLTRYLVKEDHGTSTRLPEVFIEGITAGSQSVSLANARIPAGKGSMQVSFTSPMFRDAENLRFRYRMNSDGEWSDPTSSRSFSIASLAPGRHVIEVQAIDGYDRTSTTSAQQVITVLPAFWQSWWFRALALLTLGGLSAAVPLLRAHRLSEQGERLEHEVDLRTTQLAEQAQRLEREASEREAAQVELQRSEERLRDIVEHATNLFYSHTPEGVLTYASPQSQALLGIEPENLLRHFREFTTNNPNNAVGLAATQLAIQTKEKQPPYEMELRHASGELVYVLVHETPVVVNGEVVAIVGSLTNITAEKQARANEERMSEQLRQAQKMEAIGRLTGGIAHDFNNLLTAISGNAEVVLDSLESDDVFPKSEVRKDVSDILSATGRASSLVAQLMAFSRQQLIKRSALDLNVLVLESSRMLQRIVGTDMTFDVQTCDTPAWIMADQGQIDQVLVNLATNARDAMPNGGQLNIAVSREVHATPIADDVSAGAYIVLSVTDTGAGMDAATMSRIFEPFFTTKSIGQGTGLGLATVYGIVKQNSGHVAASSSIGHGTTIRVYLPESAAPEIAPAELIAPINATASPNDERVILVVDDEDMVRNVVCRALRSYGYQVIAANEGASAIAMASEYQKPIHLLLCDVVMPGMSGKEVAEHITTLRPDIQVLFMTGHTNGTLGARGLLPDELEVIHKPFRTNELKDRVAGLLAGSGAL